MTGPRVLHVINEMGTGGAERVVVDLVRGGAARGWTSAVLSSGGVRADALAADGVVTHRMRLARRSPLRLLACARDARRALRAFRPEVVLAHNVLVGVVAWLAAHTMRRRPAVVTVFHGVAAGDYRGAARTLPVTSDGVVAVSAAIAARLRAAGLAGTRLTVVRNAVALRPPPDRVVARHALGLPQNRPIVLCAARMVPQKRHDVLLAAWSLLGGNAVLLLAGDGPLRAELQARAAPLGERVRFLGARDDMDVLLAAADITVLTSDWEGLPMVALESMAASRPMVASDVDGVREALGDGAGVLVAPGDPRAVADGLLGLLRDPRRREAVARAARVRLTREHAPETVLDRYDTVLRDARASGPAGRPGRIWVAVRAGAAGVLVFAAVLAGVALAPVRYQGTVGMVARPDAGTSAVVNRDVASTGYGDVVALALPSLPELATSPSTLNATVAAVPGAPSGADLRPDVSVELVPASGVARISVRSDDEQLAARLAESLATQIGRADLLAPAGTLTAVDRQASVTEVSPGLTTGALLAVVAGLVAAAAVAALLLPRRRPGLATHAALLRAVEDAGRDPVAVLDASDPVLAERLRLLAGDTPPRVVAAGPGLQDSVHALAAVLTPIPAPSPIVRAAGPSAPVIAVADRRRTRAGELTDALAALPGSTALIAVVLL